jgi:predicted dehydrogenase
VAAAGKHVLCEKPMATNPQECEQMIAARQKADRKTMIAYRIQYEPYNRAVQAYVRDQKFGRVKFIESVNTQNQGDANQWRQKRALAGGGRSLMSVPRTQGSVFGLTSPAPGSAISFVDPCPIVNL